MKKYSVFLFIVSSIFSACTERSTNTEIASEPSRTYSANSNAMISMEVKKMMGLIKPAASDMRKLTKIRFLSFSSLLNLKCIICLQSV